MTTPRDIYYISGNTTILAKDMAKVLLNQFPDEHFREESIPFFRNAEDVAKALEKNLNQSEGRFPIIISRRFSEKLNSVFDRPVLHLFTICDQLLVRLKNILGTPATRLPGTSRIQDVCYSCKQGQCNSLHYFAR